MPTVPLLVYVKVASQKAFVTPKPLAPAFGPMPTLKMTVVPVTGLPRLSETMAVTVWSAPTGFVAVPGMRLMPCVTAMRHASSNADSRSNVVWALDIRSHESRWLLFPGR
jgi:hypothetical protein